MKIVLVHPEIPQNSGNIARTAAATNSELILIQPLGFSISDRLMKRSGMDYINQTKIRLTDDLAPLLTNSFYFFSTKGKKNYSSIKFQEHDTLIFGSESKGLPKELHEKYKDHFYTIPMKDQIRSLNLSNTVAIVIYEALRQNDFRWLH